MASSPAPSGAAATGYVPAIFAGLVASLVGIGLARFGYTPLLPVMIHAQWFDASQAAYLGAANLAGYLVGAFSGRAMARYQGPVAVLRLMTLLASVSFIGCAFPLSQVWFFCWRLLSGIAGGAIMVLVSGVVLHRVPHSKRGLASGAIFFGIGIGVILSGTVVPLMLSLSLQATWLALGGLALLLTAASWFAWPAHDHTAVRSMTSMKKAPLSPALRLLFVQYALAALGLVPEMLFLVDYIARELNHGTALGSATWVAYGIGASVGPLFYGWAADRWGARKSMLAAFGVQLLAVLALGLVNQLAALMVLAVIIGSFPAGVVPLALARLHGLSDDAHAREAIWSRLTVAFALAQALGGYAYSALYAVSNGHHLSTFLIGAAALGLALIVGLRSR